MFFSVNRNRAYKLSCFISNKIYLQRSNNCSSMLNSFTYIFIMNVLMRMIIQTKCILNWIPLFFSLGKEKYLKDMLIFHCY